MLEKLMSWIKGVWEKMIGKDMIQQKMQIEPLISSEMAQAIELWGAIFSNKSPWLNSDIKSLNLGALISSEMARSVTIEMKSEVTGSARADYINKTYQKMVDSLREKIEPGLAKGGLVIKPFVSYGKLAINYVHADYFYPTKYDASGMITAAIFVEQIQRGKKFYSRIESHNFENGIETIINRAFVSDSALTLGNETALSSITEWSGIDPQVKIQNLQMPLFAYFKVPFANQVESGCPIGVSIYSRATQLIEEADKQYSRLIWEFKSGERALYTDVTAFKQDANKNLILPDTRLYKTLDHGQEGLFHDWTPTLREENIIRGLNELLMRIEDQCGLSRGTISNPEVEARTATELKILKQRSYATVVDIQKSLQNALEHAVYIMDVLCTLYNLAPKGTYETSFEWDDSIVSDRDKQFVELQTLESMGVISKEKVYAWYFGVSEKEAKKYVPKPDPTGGFMNA